METEDVIWYKNRRNILSIILLVVAVGAFLYFALTQKPKEVYTASSNNQLIITTKPAGVPATTDGDMSNTTINSITSNSAILNGSYINGKEVSTWFEYGTNPILLSNTIKTTPVHQLNKSNNFTETISKLGANIEMFYRAVGQNSGGALTYGQILSFRTKPDTTGQAPIVETSVHQNEWQCDNDVVGNNNICLVGEYIANGLPAKAWFEYGTTKSLGKSTATQNIGSGSGDFKVQAYFNPSLKYYVRIVAKNSAGTTKGEILEYDVSVSK